jgi:1,4-dihydroxy-2-naphthoate octaprenyltransferase
LLAALLGWGCSLLPFAQAWRGWGELINAFLGALLLNVFGYVILSARVDSVVFTAVVPFTLLAFINLLGTHWPDRKADVIVGKNTLAV